MPSANPLKCFEKRFVPGRWYFPKPPRAGYKRICPPKGINNQLTAPNGTIKVMLKMSGRAQSRDGI
ncbi:MAG: hypothetical protein D6714_16800 [Bacteroidetes bacterium]|nr:MAG: hypothetical protein D6714_16800 [Bacteroidota bacterium]